MKKYNYVVLNGSNISPVLTFRVFTINTRLRNTLSNSRHVPISKESFLYLIDTIREIVAEANLVLGKVTVTNPFSKDPYVESIKTKTNNQATNIIETWIQEHPEEFL